jgi:hypothetical protein
VIFATFSKFKMQCRRKVLGSAYLPYNTKKLKLNTRRSYQKLFFAALVNNNPKTIFNQILKYSIGWFNIKILYYSFNPNITSKQAK